ncbi:MAG: hypothetical protein O6940_13665 [Ignavibacteria bacterium]|nr:hypothetical protein [Ignavibacteria bacterium]
MPKDELNLKSLRTRFLDQFKEEYLYELFEMIYDKYQEEFLLIFNPFYDELLNCLQPKKREEIDRNLFEYDFMNNICNYLNLLFLTYKLSFEQKVAEYGEPMPIALLYFNSEEEKIAKKQKLEEKSDQNDEPCFIINLDMDLVRSLIDSLILQSSIIVKMSQTKTEFISDYYKAKLRSVQKSLVALNEDAEHGKKFKGKQLTPESKKKYQDILDIQKELLAEYGPGHSSSLQKSVVVYSQRNKLYWDEGKIKSIAETIRILRKNKRI